MLFVFGREVERFIGRRAFIVLYALSSSVRRLCFSHFGGSRTRAGHRRLRRAAFRNFHRLRNDLSERRAAPADSGEMGRAGPRGHFHPAVLAYRDWSAMAVLWISIATAFFFIRLRGIGPELVWWSDLKSRWQPKPKFQVVPRSTPRRVVEPENVHDSIDPVLDKISKQGINSLTASERRALDRARARLLKKTRRKSSWHRSYAAIHSTRSAPARSCSTNSSAVVAAMSASRFALSFTTRATAPTQTR